MLPDPQSSPFTPEFLDALADLITERVCARLTVRDRIEWSPYIGVTDCAAYLACGKDRIYDLVSRNQMPHHKDGSRTLFKMDEIDAWVARGGATRQGGKG